MLKHSDKIINNTIYGGLKEVHGFNLATPAAAPLREVGMISLGMARIGDPYIMSRKGGNEYDHTHYHIILEGREHLETLDTDYDIEEGEFVAVPQRFRRRYSLPQNGQYLFLFLSIDNYAADPSFKFDNVCKSSIETKKLESVYRMLAEESENPARSGSETIVRASAEAFLALLRRAVNNVRAPFKCNEEDTLRELWNRVQEQLNEPWTFGSLAKAAGVSKTQLHTLCLRHYAMPPMERLTKLRMEKARKLLIESPDKLDAIAGAIGYGSAYAFSKAFLCATGRRPGQFRKGF